MYVSIDLENLIFLHKHEDVMVVCNLVHIEAPHVEVCISSCCGQTFLSNFTEMELRALYCNTTNADKVSYSAKELRAILVDIAERLPVADVVKFELDRQAELVPEGSIDPLKYVKGATRSGKPAELFPLQASRSPNEEKIAASAARAAVQPAARKERAPTPALPQLRAQQVPATPRQGGVRAIVWEVADALWEKEGKPTNKQQVLTLRKRMMCILESEHGVKRTSSSNELGQWQKSRLNNLS